MATNSLTIGIGAKLESSFPGSLKAAKNSIGSLSKELATLKKQQQQIQKLEMNTSSLKAAKAELTTVSNAANELRNAYQSVKQSQSLIQDFELQTRGIDKAESQLASVNKQLTKLRKASGSNPTGTLKASINALESEARTLNRTLDQSHNELSQTGAAMQQAGINVSSLRHEKNRLKSTTKQLGGELKTAERHVQSLQGDIAKLELSVNKSRDELDKAGMSTRNTGAALSKLGDEEGRLTRQINKKNAAIVRSEKRSAQLGRLYGVLKTGALAVGAAVVGLAVSVGVASSNLMTLSQELENAERQLGVSSQSLQTWGLGAERVGLSSEKMRDILKDTSDKLGDFATTGGGEAADIIERLGLNINTLINQKPDQALLSIATAMDTVKNISQHDRIFLLESLADEGSALLPLLKDNASQLREIETVAQMRGVIITREEEQILSAANAQMADMKMALSGLSQEAGLLGSEIFTAFGPAFTDSIDSMIVSVRGFRRDAGLMAEVWGESLRSMDGQSLLFGESGTQVFSQVYEKARLGFTYLPVLAKATYTALQAYGQDWGHSAMANWEQFKALTSSVLATVVDHGAKAFGALAGAGGKAIGFILNRVAELVSGFSIIGKIPGMEEFGAKIEGISGSIKQLAIDSNTVGEQVSQSFKTQANSIRLSALASLDNAKAHKAAAGGARMAAQAAIDNAAAYIKRKESQRDINEQIRRENAELGGLTSALDQASSSGQRFQSIAKEKAAAETRAKTAVKAAKEAQEKAAKADKERTSSLKQLADTLRGLHQSLDQQIIKYTRGEEAAERFKLKTQGIIGTEQDGIISKQQYVEALKAQAEQAKQSAEAAQKLKEAIASVHESLDLEILTLTKGEEAAERYRLKKQGIVGTEQDGIISKQQYVEALKAQAEQAKQSAEAAKKLKEAIASVHASLDLEILTLTKGEEAAERYRLKKQGIVGTEQDGIISKQRYIDSLKKQAEATKKATEKTRQLQDGIKKLQQDLQYEVILLRDGAEAAERFRLKLDGYDKKQRDTIVTTKDHIEKIKKLKDTAKNIGDTLVDGLLSGNWKSAGKQLLGILGDVLISPLKQTLSNAISQALTGGSAGSGGLLGGISSIFSGGSGGGGLLGGISSIFGGGAGGGISGLLGGVTNYIGGIGKAVGGLFSGSGGLGGLMSAIGPMGLLGGGLAALAGLFFGPSDPELTFSQNMRADRRLTGTGSHLGKEHYRQTALTGDGYVGATLDSYKLGRKGNFVPKFHQLLNSIEQFDGLIARTLPEHVQGITAALKDVEMQGFSTEDMLRKRYTTVIKALPPTLARAMKAGKKFVDMSTEEIMAQFKLMADVSSSGLSTSLQRLGWDMGTTKDQALAASMGLVNAAGGLASLNQKLGYYTQNFYSEQERLQMKQATAAEQVKRFNDEIGRTGAGAIDTRAKLRAYIESQNSQTEAGQKAIAAALAVAESMVTVSDSGKPLEDLLSSLPTHLKQAAGIKGDPVNKAAKSLKDAGESTVKVLTDVATALGKVTKSVSATAANDSRYGVDGSHASGLAVVPKEPYIARLHKGERVSTKAENDLLRTGQVVQLRGRKIVPVSAAQQRFEQINQQSQQAAGNRAGRTGQLVQNNTINITVNGADQSAEALEQRIEQAVYQALERQRREYERDMRTEYSDWEAA